MGARAGSELDREAAHAPGGAGDEHATLDQEPAETEGVVGGQPGHRERGRCRERHLVGQRAQPVGGHGRKLGPRARPRERSAHSHHACAGRRAAAVGRGLAHHAGHVPAGEAALGQRLEAPDLAAIDGHRPHLHERLARRRRGVGRLAEADVRGLCGGQDRAHAPRLESLACPSRGRSEKPRNRGDKT